MANTQELMLRIRGDNTDAEKKLADTSRSIGNFGTTTEKASSAIRQFSGELRNVRDVSDLVAAGTRALGGVIAGSLAGTAVIAAGRAIVDAYNNVQKASTEAEKSVAELTKTTEKIGAGAGMQETASAAQALFNESNKVSEKLKEIDSNKLQGLIAGITGAREKMSSLVEETKNQAKELEERGIVNTLIELKTQQTLSETDKKLVAISEKYKPIIDAARASGNEQLLNNAILQAQEERVSVLAKEKEDLNKKEKADLEERNKIIQSGIDYQQKLKDDAEFDAMQRERQSERTRAELSEQTKLNEKKIAQEKEIARFISEQGSARAEAGIQQEAIALGGSLLMATRAGRQTLEFERRARQREVTRENFMAGSRLSADQRRSMARDMAKGEMASIVEKSAGQQRFNSLLERLISIYQSAPLITSGAGN